MTTVLGILAAALLFAGYGLLARRCDCDGPRCGSCPFGEKHDE